MVGGTSFDIDVSVLREGKQFKWAGIVMDVRVDMRDLPTDPDSNSFQYVCGALMATVFSGLWPGAKRKRE